MSKQSYVVAKTTSLDFLSTITSPENESTFEGVKFSYNIEKVKTFQRSCKCVACGLEASVLHLERMKGCNHEVYGKEHLNLYGVIPSGERILFTVDHDVLKSKGGANSTENYNTMCVVCNRRRGSKYEKLSDFLALYNGVSTAQYWENYMKRHEVNEAKRIAQRKERAAKAKVMKGAHVEEYLAYGCFAHIGDYNRHMRKLKKLEKELTQSK